MTAIRNSGTLHISSSVHYSTHRSSLIAFHFFSLSSLFTSWSYHADSLARPSLWRPPLTQEVRVHLDCHSHTRTRDRRQYRDLQRRQCGAPAPVAVLRTGSDHGVRAG